MKLSVSELAKRALVSVRTLHYYDEIGLLKPAYITDANYRYYNEESLRRLELILYYRELDFPLTEIAEILNKSDFDRDLALAQQARLLKLKRDRLTRLIAQLETSIKGGAMSFEEFDMSEIEEAKEKYGKEAEERWGHTDAYQESARKAKSYGPQDWERIKNEQDVIYRGFAELAAQGADPASEEARTLVIAWQDNITRNFYHCTNEILAGLGQMYVADPRFTTTIDKYGEGTAAFKSAAIAAYVG